MFGFNSAQKKAERSSADPYAPARDQMIEEQLRARGIVRHRVLDAMRAVPRHLFVAHDYQDRAYADEALPSEEGQTISQPYMVAVMTQELDVRPGQWVLEIGTGTGYQTAILAWLVGATGRVFSIERVPALAESARRRLGMIGQGDGGGETGGGGENGERMWGGRVEVMVGGGSEGWPGDEVGFDRIIVTAAAPEVPEPVVKQLKTGGIMIVPVGRGDTQTLLRIVRRPEGEERTHLMACRFVPLLGKFAWDTDEYQRLQSERNSSP